jgi:hypothetical protein
MVEWIRERLLAAALSAAGTITVLSLISPAWLDFMFDLIMVLIVWAVATLRKGMK